MSNGKESLCSTPPKHDLSLDSGQVGQKPSSQPRVETSKDRLTIIGPSSSVTKPSDNGVQDGQQNALSYSKTKIIILP